ncbi:MAG: hypothetical protein C5B51_07385 [Terriglobia bacterium]|nr:MAG: hypothetical protein C5B51_07385 [Terriglobia bacterium]
MRSKRTSVLLAGTAAIAVGIYAETSRVSAQKQSSRDPVDIAVEKGVKWLVSVQGHDGGWGQDGGETSYIREGEHLESNGNDVANTAVAAEALLHTGNTPTRGVYQQNLQRAVNFILQRVEQSPPDGLAVTGLMGTQIQRKLGPYIDTFLTSRLLAELDGEMGDAQVNARVRQSLQKCVAKIEKNQLKDGSWNIAGGWAPILGTSMASQSLFVAQRKGVAVNQVTMAKVEDYTQRTAGSGGGSGSGIGGGTIGGARAVSAPAAAAETVAVAAGVPLYKRAQELEQLSRTEADRKKNAGQIAAIREQLSDTRFATGFGSIGGEEFFSYLNISDSLHRTGGAEWEKWNTDIKAKILKMQNEDGTWAGHHCITGRVAVTSAAILTLLAERDRPVIPASAKR